MSTNPHEVQNLDALVLLFNLFTDLSDEPVSNMVEFKREILVRWKLWRDVEGWKLPSQKLGGHWELHLRESALGVRFFHGEDVVVAMRVLLGEAEGLVSPFIKLADDPSARTIAVRLLETVSYNAILQPLEWSLCKALQKFLPVADLAQEMSGEVALPFSRPNVVTSQGERQ